MTILDKLLEKWVVEKRISSDNTPAMKKDLSDLVEMIVEESQEDAYSQGYDDAMDEYSQYFDEKDDEDDEEVEELNFDTK